MKNQKSHEVAENIAGLIGDPIIHINQKVSTGGKINGVTPKSRGIPIPKITIPCDCGCGLTFPERANKRFYSRKHKDDFRNKLRWEKQKKAIELARLILELHEKGGG